MHWNCNDTDGSRVGAIEINLSLQLKELNDMSFPEKAIISYRDTAKITCERQRLTKP